MYIYIYNQGKKTYQLITGQSFQVGPTLAKPDQTDMPNQVEK